MLTPQRELARLEGVAGQVEASIAENRGKIAEIEIQRVRLVSKAREDAIAELRELEFQEIETREKRRQILDRMARLYLRAPVSGTVYGSTADTVRAVIRSAEPVMYIVPKDTPLIVRTRIDTIHIDQVHVGQEAILRFSAFDQRTTPELRGHVTDVSADAYSDERTGQRYYKADIELDDKEADKLDARDAPAGDAGRVVHPDRVAERAQLLREADGGLLHPRLPGRVRAAGRDRRGVADDERRSRQPRSSSRAANPGEGRTSGSWRILGAVWLRSARRVAADETLTARSRGRPLRRGRRLEMARFDVRE